MNKKQLYESIMKNVAREVKKALNENNNEAYKLAKTIYDGLNGDKPIKDMEEKHISEPICIADVITELQKLMKK